VTAHLVRVFLGFVFDWRNIGRIIHR